MLFFFNTNKYTTFTNDMLTRLPRVETPGIDRELVFLSLLLLLLFFLIKSAISFELDLFRSYFEFVFYAKPEAVKLGIKNL